MRRLPTPLACLFATTLLGACTPDGPTAPAARIDANGGIAATRGQPDRPLPYRAVVSGNVVMGVGPANCPAGTVPASAISGGGTAAHLGRFTIVSQTACLTGSGGTQGSLVWRAANGDLLTGEFTFTTTPPDANGLVIVTSVDAVITGGTGRFAGASGSQHLVAGVFQLTGPTTFTFRVSLEGTIVYDASGAAS